MPDPHTVDPTRCPLCGTPNACAAEVERQTGVAQGPCWCMTTHFDDALMQRIPSDARGVACICARCATSAERLG